MQNFVFNIAKGRVAELVHRVDANDPANSALILVPLSVGGSAAQGQDFATLAAVLADVNFDEQTTGSWVRKTLTDANIADFTVDNASNVVTCALPAVVWTAPTTNIVGILVCYDSDTTSGTDSNIIPLCAHVLSITGNGNDVTLTAGNFYQAA